MKTGGAVMKLVSMGYHFELVGGKVRYDWQGPGDPDAGQVPPLLDLVRQHKTEVVEFLRCFCPRCGGCCFVPVGEENFCLHCDWQMLTRLYPAMAVVKR
ncbi:MAG: hypothetical protein ABSA09_00690 [Desulfobaccales bacterium]